MWTKDSLSRIARRRPSPALVIACAALFVALGGTGYAVSQLPKNSVGTRQLKDDAVVSAKVKDHSLKAKDLAAGAIPPGVVSFDDLEGMPCRVGTLKEGSTSVEYDPSGAATVTCELVSDVDRCQLQTPASMTVGSGQSTPDVFGIVAEAGTTDEDGPSLVIGDVGVGPAGSDPRTDGSWDWTSAAWQEDFGLGSEVFHGSFITGAPGDYSYAYRFSLNSGDTYAYCDLDGSGEGNSQLGPLPFSLDQLGELTVTP